MRVNIGFPVVRTDGRAYGYVITKFSRMGRLPHFLSHGAPSTRAPRARVELRYYQLLHPFAKKITDTPERDYYFVTLSEKHFKGERPGQLIYQKKNGSVPKV